MALVSCGYGAAVVDRAPALEARPSRPEVSLWAGASAPEPRPTEAPVVRAPGPRYAMDLYGKGDFVPQYTSEWCVAASIQMAINITQPRNTHSRSRQRTIWERARDLSHSRFGGANPVGWSRLLTELGVGRYELVGVEDYDEALRTAAAAIRQTRRPVGLVMWSGFHAWVMSGFTSLGDPLTREDFKVTGVRVLDPLYPHGSRAWGRSPKPDELLTPAELNESGFIRRRRLILDYGRQNSFILVLPRPPEPFVRPPATSHSI